MINKIAKEISQYNKLLIWLIIFIMYVSVDTFLFGTSNLSLCTYIYYISYFSLAIYASLFIMKKVHYFTNLMFVFTIILLFMLMTMASNMDITGGYFLYIAVYIISIFIVMRFPLKDFLYAFETIFYYWTCASLIAYFLFLTFPIIGEILPSIPNSAGYDFKILIFTNFFHSTSSTDDFSIPRNVSIFREPGVYMLYILIAMMVIIFLRKNINKKRFIIYLITMFTTFSTAGILLGSCLLLYVAITTKDKKMKILLLLFFLVFSAFVFAGESVIYDKIFNKFDEDTSAYESTMARIASITIPIEILFDNLYLGCGITNFPLQFTNYAIQFYGISLNTSGSSTNFILNTFAVYGIFIGTIFILMLYGWCKKIQYKSNSFVSIFLLLILCAAFSNEDVRYSPFFHILLFYSLAGSNSYYNKNNSINRIR